MYQIIAINSFANKYKLYYNVKDYLCGPFIIKKEREMYNLIFNTQISPQEKVIIFLSYTLAVMIALTIHEFSHAFVAHKLGDNTAKLAGRLSLNPIVHFDVLGLISFVIFGFGWARPVPINPYNFRNIRKGTLLVSLAGIIANLILAFVFYPLALLLLRVSDGTIALDFLSYLFYFIYLTNLALMVFNLLPVYPLDGFNALASQVSYSNSYVNFNYRYGPILLIALALIISYTNVFQKLIVIIGYPITAFWGLFF